MIKRLLGIVVAAAVVAVIALTALHHGKYVSMVFGPEPSEVPDAGIAAGSAGRSSVSREAAQIPETAVPDADSLALPSAIPPADSAFAATGGI